MITRADIVERVGEWGLAEQVVEKDYVLGWLLWGIANDPTLGQAWVFKGGTCLKKCYMESPGATRPQWMNSVRALARGARPHRRSVDLDCRGEAATANVR